jgi:ribosomal protein S7
METLTKRTHEETIDLMILEFMKMAKKLHAKSIRLDSCEKQLTIQIQKNQELVDSIHWLCDNSGIKIPQEIRKRLKEEYPK